MLELPTSMCLFPTVIPSMRILLKSVMVFEDNNLIFQNNMLLSVLFAYSMHVSKESGLSSVVLTRILGLLKCKINRLLTSERQKLNPVSLLLIISLYFSLKKNNFRSVTKIWLW